jgi:hypothetical protein
VFSLSLAFASACVRKRQPSMLFLQLHSPGLQSGVKLERTERFQHSKWLVIVGHFPLNHIETQKKEHPNCLKLYVHDKAFPLVRFSKKYCSKVKEEVAEHLKNVFRAEQNDKLPIRNTQTKKILKWQSCFLTTL